MRRLGYQALIFLPPGTGADLPDAYKVLSTCFGSSAGKSTPKIELKGDTITVSRGKWSLYVSLDMGPHVVGEAKEIAANAGRRFDNAGMLAFSQARFDLASDADLSGEHLYLYLDVVVALSDHYPGSSAFDPSSGGFI